MGQATAQTASDVNGTAYLQHLRGYGIIITDANKAVNTGWEACSLLTRTTDKRAAQVLLNRYDDITTRTAPLIVQAAKDTLCPWVGDNTLPTFRV